jgi:hypothetical protein
VCLFRTVSRCHLLRASSQYSTIATKREFNISGPSDPSKHYYLDPLQLHGDTTSAFSSATCLKLIHDQRYFVLHGPRQSMKTSFLKALQQHINTNMSSEFVCIRSSLEGLDVYTKKEEEQAVVQKVCQELGMSAKSEGGIALQAWEDTMKAVKHEFALSVGPFVPSLALYLSEWSRALGNKKLVLLIDEFDVLGGEILGIILAQLRVRYDERPRGYPASIVLCGMRNLREIRSETGVPLVRGSPFNITDRSIRTIPFTLDHVKQLYQQHTDDTGQAFSPESLERVMYWTAGQPWLVNKMGQEICFDMTQWSTNLFDANRDKPLPSKDRSVGVTVEAVDSAAQNIIMSHSSHIDSLANRLKEPSVRRVVNAVIVGGDRERFSADDLEYVTDLGILQPGGKVFANRIYGEVIPRQLASLLLENVSENVFPTYRHSDGSINGAVLVNEFIDLLRENVNVWSTVKTIEKDRQVYKGANFFEMESNVHLLWHFYLQRVVNGGGQLIREAALGGDKVDSRVIMKNTKQSLLFEFKLAEASGNRNDNDKLDDKMLSQVDNYLSQTATGELFLIVFSRKAKEVEGSSRGVFFAEKTIGNSGKTIKCWVVNLKAIGVKSAKQL